MYSGNRPVRRSDVRVSETSAPSGVRNDVATAPPAAVGGSFEGARPIRREIWAISAARAGDCACRYAAR